MRPLSLPVSERNSNFFASPLPSCTPEARTFTRLASLFVRLLREAQGLSSDVHRFDGTIAHILIDGVEVFSRFVAGSDTVGVQYTIAATVNIGSGVDSAIASGESDCDDSTKFTVTISLTR